jgi:tetratricopeptide (TPR) repeat protein
MGKVCFVIMPYGQDADRRALNSAVYEQIIEPVARSKGYEVHRADTRDVAVGNISQSIVTDLVLADLVIADMSELNANVFYELGVRHALHRNGTVIIIQDGYTIPFDLSQYVTVRYTATLPGLAAAHEKITQAVTAQETALALVTPNSETPADNPVWDFFPSLSSVRSTGTDIALQSEVTRLSAELQSAMDALVSQGIDITGRVTQTESILRSLREANELVQKGGMPALLELRMAAQNNDINLFEGLLQQIMTTPMLTSENYREISEMCKDLGLTPHRVIVLREANRLFPNDTSIVAHLAVAYGDQPQPEMVMRGRQLMEESMGIEYRHGLPSATSRTMDEFVPLAALLDIYMAQEDWEAMKGFCLSARDQGLTSNLIEKNLGRALLYLKDFEGAEAALLAAADAEPANDTISTLLSELYRRTGDFEKALVTQEQALIIDADASNWANLGVEILQNGRIHDAEGKLCGPIPRKERYAEAEVIFNRALQLDSSVAFRQLVAKILLNRSLRTSAQQVLADAHIATTYESRELAYIDPKVSE